MVGDIILRIGIYLEIVLEESGSTRLILCCDFKPGEEMPVKVRQYRIGYWDAGQLYHQTASSLADAQASFYERIGGKPQTDMQKCLFMRQLAERIDRGVCIHCGTAENVMRALCVECRALPQFQAVLPQ
jgi:hypothetical protein